MVRDSSRPLTSSGSSAISPGLPPRTSSVTLALLGLLSYSALNTTLVSGMVKSKTSAFSFAPSPETAPTSTRQARKRCPASFSASALTRTESPRCASSYSSPFTVCSPTVFTVPFTVFTVNLGISSSPPGSMVSSVPSGRLLSAVTPLFPLGRATTVYTPL